MKKPATQTQQNTTPPNIDHDRLFKELITNLFIEFLELFAPQIASAIDRDSIEFIDKEVFSDLVLGDENIGDILVKVRIAGKEQFILIHIENQSAAEANFTERMFEYFYLFRAKFRLPIYPIAVFSFEEPFRVEPNVYAETTFGLHVIRYEFQPIQLNQMNWRNYLGSNNPAAVALMAKMQVKPEDRITVRKECLRMFVTLKLDRKKVRVINEFMGTYLQLTAEDAKQLRREIETTVPQKEQQEYYVYVNEFELLAREEGLAQGVEQGIAQGVEQGIAQGLREGELRSVLRLLHTKLGTIDEAVRQRTTTLTIEKLEALSVALLKFQTAEELQSWLDVNA